MNTLRTILAAGLMAAALPMAAEEPVNGNVIIKLVKDKAPLIYSADEIEYIQFTDEEMQDESNLLQEAYIPDPLLREWVMAKVTDGEPYLSREQAADYTGAIDLKPYLGIVSLQGLEFFTSVRNLDIYSQSSIDINTIPRMENIAIFNCQSCGFDNFDIMERFPNVANLSMGQNNFTGDLKFVSAKLKYLDCHWNDITGLDLSECPAMQQVVCSKCNLSKIDLGTGQYTAIYAHENFDLEEIDLSYCKETLQKLNVGGTALKTIDLTGATELTSLEIWETQMTECPDLSSCIYMERLRCEGNGFTELDVTQFPYINELYCYDNKITTLDLSNSPWISMCMAWNNEITKVNLDGCQSLERLDISQNNCVRVDLSVCNQQRLVYFNARKNPDLTEVKVWSDFDMQNPPESYTIPETASFVYEFSE